MKVLVCGGRDFLDWPALFNVLDQLPITRVIEGGATGADTGAAMWAFCRGIPYEEYPADWGRYGLKAGPRRNQRMLTFGRPELVVAFPGGPGTRDMVKRATSTGFRVLQCCQ